MSMQRWKPGMPVTPGEPLHHVDTSKDDAAGLVVFGWLLASVAGFLGPRIPADPVPSCCQD